MQYLINGEVVFRPVDGAIWNITQPENVVILASIPCRILNYLFECSDRVVSRDDFYTEVWDKYGLQSSNNSLNQNISLIRKTLHELGCDAELVQTIPHIGYMINTQLFVKVDAVHSSDRVKNDTKKHYNKIFTYLACAFLSIVSGILVNIFGFSTNNTIPTQSLFLLGNTGGCEIHTVFESSKELSQKKLEIANSIINKLLPCGNVEIYFFQPEDSYVHDNKGRVFLSRCTYQRLKSTNFAGCKDIYVHKI